MIRRLLIAFTLLGATIVAQPAAGQSHDPSLLHLRRAAFDPLDKAAPASALPDGDLLLVQLDAPPDAATAGRLAAAGLRALWYIPQSAYLVRAEAGAGPQSLAGLRWFGPYDPINKLAPELDARLAAGAGALDLQLVVAPDRAPEDVAQALHRLGGAVVERADSLSGAALRVSAPAAALPALLARGDVLWIEPWYPASVLDDRARALAGVPQAQAAYGLTGAGQRVAVTDTGLDVQATLSADFAGRVARGFSRAEMYPFCSALSSFQEPNTWSDLHGHGTHVAGMALGSGALSGGQFAGIAPGAQLVMQAVSSGGSELDCLPDAKTYLQLAYDAGARVHNGSFGRRTGSGSCSYGCYTAEAATVDDFLWQHKDYLFVVAAGNSGRDIAEPLGVIDPDAIGSPAVAKNVLTVGASENNRPGAAGCSTTIPEQFCWSYFDSSNSLGLRSAPFGTDPISNDPAGMAAWSSRGPTDDGRIKPEIVAPGTNIVSARTHYPGVSYGTRYDANYVYLSGTSMAAPQVSGMAALAREWLSVRRGVASPSAALLRALLVNGAVDMSPGQYADEIPSVWPNSVQGWGRASIAGALGVGSADGVWFAEGAGLSTGQQVEYPLRIAAGQPLRVTLSWTDYPGAPGAGRALVNDLDLELVTPGGTVLGNVSAALPDACRSAGADRCNTTESVAIAAPVSGDYVVRVRAAAVPQGPQPFALAVGAAAALDLSLAAPQLAAVAVSGPSLGLSWTSVAGAASYRVEVAESPAFGGAQTIDVGGTSLQLIETVGTRYVRVRACAPGGCGQESNTQSAVVSVAPSQIFVPAVGP